MSSSGRYFVYILANRRHGATYVGVTGNLIGRTYVHRNDLLDGFSARYRIHSLVYFEQHQDPYEAITREKRIKKWRQAWKHDLIDKFNPEWRDLFDDIAGG